MKRGELCRVLQIGRRSEALPYVRDCEPSGTHRFEALICAGVYDRGEDLATQVAIASRERLERASSIMSDNLASPRKPDLMLYVGSLGTAKQAEVGKVLKLARDWDDERRESLAAAQKRRGQVGATKCPCRGWYGPG